MKSSESIKQIAPAFLSAQIEIESAEKTGVNPHFRSKYADLTAIIDAVKKPLNGHGIAILQPVNGMEVETILIHTSGEWLSSSTPIVCREPNNPQALGSAITYAKRYGLQSMVLLPAEDDDGNAASGVSDRSEQTVPVKTSSQPFTPPPGVGTGRTIPITQKQLNMIMALLPQKGYSDEQLKQEYGVQSKKDLSIAQGSKIIDMLLKLPDAPTDDSYQRWVEDEV